MRSGPSTSAFACSWMRPERSSRSRKAILPWPRRACEAARDAVAVLGVGAVAQLGVGRVDRGDRPDARVLVRERVDPVRAQALELRAADREQLGLFAHRRG